MGRYLKLAILTACLGAYAAIAMADDPSASTQSPPAAATATHAMAATTEQAAGTVTQPEATNAASAAPAATTSANKTEPTTSSAPTANAALPVQSNNGPTMPTRGMSMDNVEHIFGVPQEKLPAVPDPGSKLHPPITRWVYPNYVVYFEYNLVINTVMKDHPFSSDSSKN
jgi:hypothetical protein